MNKKKKILFISSCLTVALCGTLFTYNTNASEKFGVPKNQKFDAIALYKSIDKTEKSLKEYKNSTINKNKLLKEKKVKDIISTITMDKPLNTSELPKFIQDINIEKVKQVQGRILTSSGERLTFVSAYTTEEGVMQKRVDDLLKKLSDGQFVGYTAIYATIDSENLDAIEKNSFVYSCDTSGDSYFTDENDSGYPQALTWLLEDIKSTKK